MTKSYIITILLLLVFGLGSMTLTVSPASDRPSQGFPGPESTVVSTLVSAQESIPAQQPTPAPKVTPAQESIPTQNPMAERVRAMTDKELAGQLLVVGMEGTAPREDAKAAIQDYHVGGMILFGRNIDSGDQLNALTASLKAMNAEAGNPPLFLCVDEEGGQVARLTKLEGTLPTPYDYIQNGGDPAEWGDTLAKRCDRYGLNMDFAPVLDVWSNPKNTVIGERAFGTDARTVAESGWRIARSMSDNGVIPVGKHFPGHGDTEVDSHVGLPVVNKTVEELEELELIPFREAIRYGDLPAVMVAHILMSKIDPNLPASLSSAVVEGLLRADLDFDGVVFTDDLTMGAISKSWGLEEAVVMAVNAGCDQLLICHGADNAKTAYQALLSALADGTLSRERAEESVRRVLALKERF